MSGSAFSTGFTFNYWDKNKTPKHMDSETATKMAVEPVHDSLKNEVVGHHDVNSRKWRENIVLKAEKYLDSESVRKITAQRARYDTPTGQNEK